MSLPYDIYVSVIGIGIGRYAKYLSVSADMKSAIIGHSMLNVNIKILFMAIHICQRQYLSNFFLKKIRVSKDNFVRFY